MPHHASAVATLGLLAAFAPGRAAAQTRTPTAAETIMVSGGASARSKASDWMIMPSGTATIGGTLRFITAPSGLGDQRMLFTDVVLMSLDARWSLEKRLEIFATTNFLPKQPSTTDELVWQSAAAGARIGVGRRYAVYTSFGGGPLLEGRGMWGAGDLGVQARKSLHPTLVLEGTAGGSYTGLFEQDRDQPSWLAETVMRGELVFRDPRGMMAVWLGTEFRFPVADGSSMSTRGEAGYDPQTRVNVNLGVVLSYIQNWDIFASYVIVDRGDRSNPATTLPMLDGGFDQKHIIIGLTRRYRPSNRQRGSMTLAR